MSEPERKPFSLASVESRWFGVHDKVPQEIKDALFRYSEWGLMTGGFLEAVLTNDLRSACVRADMQNFELIPYIVKYMEDFLPTQSWGSRKAVEEWLAKKDKQFRNVETSL